MVAELAELAELLGKLAQLGQLAELVAPPLTAPIALVPGSAPDSLPLPGDWEGRLELLVLQPTPFCNLDCDYCYLPDRGNPNRMQFRTLDAVARKVFAARLPAAALSVVWHAGEPLTLPPAWYEEAFARIERYRPPGVNLAHHFQTNGVLIDPRWCALIQRHPVRIGLSIDGPQWLHDRHRKRRDGRGTHAQVMRGVECLRAAGIPFHVICVLTRDSLPHPDEIFDFFTTIGAEHLGFNIEEFEGAHAASSLAEPHAEEELRRFLTRIVQRIRQAPTIFRLRELHDVIAILRHPLFGAMTGNSQNTAGRIINVAWDGTFSTYSPELLGQRHPRLGSLALGNILVDTIVPDAAHAAFARMSTEVNLGVSRCRAECKYFSFCLGGAPANKLAETGRLDSTETMFCRLTQQVVTDVVLETLERDLPT